MIKGLVFRMKHYLPFGLADHPLKLIRESRMKHCSLEFGEGVSNHDGPMVVWN